MGRRSVPAHLRPSFSEFEKHCKQSSASAAATSEAAPAATEAAPASS
jgi:hypothetical protein